LYAGAWGPKPAGLNKMAHREGRMKVLSTVLVASGLVFATANVSFGQDAAKGKSVFNQCLACHALDHAVVGPLLGGVIGRKAGSVEGFSYSPLMKAAGDAGLTWTTAELVDYLKNPTEYLTTYVKGKGKEASGSSKMVFMLSSENQRKNVAAYLETAKK
jgi:cytochrome c